MIKKVLVTGSEGFVGQHLVHALKQDYSVVGLSRSTPLPNSKNLEYEIGDILDSDFFYNLLKKHKPDAILHLAGIAKTWGNDPTSVFNINLFGTLNIYESVLKLKSEEFDPKIIFISSAEVYGKTNHPENITEDSALNPINTYGSSKLAADRLSFEYSQTKGLYIIILRPFPHIGPGQQKGFFVPDMASQIIEIEKDPERHEILTGNLDATRDYLDVRDVVEAYKLSLEKDFTPGEVYNVCSGKGIKIQTILEKLLQLTDKKIEIKKDLSRMRPVDLPVYIGNNSKFVEATGWSPTVSIDQSLKDVLDYWGVK